MKYQPDTLTMPDGTPLFLHVWLPDSPPEAGIVLAHGYGEHAGRYAHLAAFLTAQGYAIYAPDHRGHGRSAGGHIGYFERFALLREDLKTVWDFAAPKLAGMPMFLVGHSVGSLMALSFVIKYPQQQEIISAMVLSAPFVSTIEEYSVVQRLAVRNLSRIAPRIAVTPRVDSGILSHDPAMVSGYDSDPYVFHGKVSARVADELVTAGDDVRAHLNQVTLPTLIMHGTGDRLAKPDYAKVIYAGIRSADKTLINYDGFFHEILNEIEKERVMADLSKWLALHKSTKEK